MHISVLKTTQTRCLVIMSEIILPLKRYIIIGELTLIVQYLFFHYIFRKYSKYQTVVDQTGLFHLMAFIAVFFSLIYFPHDIHYVFLNSTHVNKILRIGAYYLKKISVSMNIYIQGTVHGDRLVNYL